MSGSWSWTAVVSEGLLGDKTALAAHLDQLEGEARAAALEVGVELGRPTTVAMHPQVWVERWSKEGGAYVAPAIARLAGVVGEKAGALCVFSWPIVEPAACRYDETPATCPGVGCADSGRCLRQLAPAGEPAAPGSSESDHGAPGGRPAAPARGFVVESGL